MSAIEALVLGIIQGLTEFLPISSSGHLILAGKLFGISEMPLAFELMTHLATLLAVVIVLRKPLFALVKKPFQKKTALLIVATVPTVGMFLLFHMTMKSAFDGRFLILAFGITAILILISGAIIRKEPKPLPSFLDAALIGIAQGIAGFPGISRSGATICTAKLSGVQQESAAEFSFLLSIPIIIGSALWELIAGDSFGNLSPVPLIIGFCSAFLVGLGSIKLMLKLLAKRSMAGFAVYLTLLVIFLTLDRFFWGVFI